MGVNGTTLIMNTTKKRTTNENGAETIQLPRFGTKLVSRIHQNGISLYSVLLPERLELLVIQKYLELESGK